MKNVDLTFAKSVRLGIKDSLAQTKAVIMGIQQLLITHIQKHIRLGMIVFPVMHVSVISKWSTVFGDVNRIRMVIAEETGVSNAER